MIMTQNIAGIGRAGTKLRTWFSLVLRAVETSHAAPFVWSTRNVLPTEKKAKLTFLAYLLMPLFDVLVMLDIPIQDEN
jgi:hypothetical protein